MTDRLEVLAVLGLCLTACGGEQAVPTAATPDKQLFIGQDLGAIRGYMASDCCPQPGGLTTYVGFYDILLEGDFGGLGIDLDGNDAGFELDWQSGPISGIRTAREFGAMNLAIGLSLTENEHPGKLQRLVDGDFDAEIKQLARFIRMVDGTVYLRIGYEFDGAWNQGYEDAPRYIAAWRRIVDGLRQEGASNMVTVWQASAAVVDDIIDGRSEDIAAWYPGDEYVDWMGFSWFMPPHEQVEVASSFDPGTPLVLAEELLVFARHRGKPVMVAEASPQAMDLNEKFMANHSPLWDGDAGTGRVDMTDEQIWNHWFAPTFRLLEDNCDVIHILAYINVDWDSQAMWGPPYESGFWGDTRLEANEEIAARFSEAIAAWSSSGMCSSASD